MADTRPAAGEGSERSGEPKVPAQDQPAHELANLIAESDAKGKGFWRRRRRKAAGTPDVAAPVAPAAPAVEVPPTKPEEKPVDEVVEPVESVADTTEAEAEVVAEPDPEPETPAEPEAEAKSEDEDEVEPGDAEENRPTVGVVYEPDESADGFPLEYGEIIIGLPKQPDTNEKPTDASTEAEAEAAAVAEAEGTEPEADVEAPSEAERQTEDEPESEVQAEDEAEAEVEAAADAAEAVEDSGDDETPADEQASADPESTDAADTEAEVAAEATEDTEPTVDAEAEVTTETAAEADTDGTEPEPTTEPETDGEPTAEAAPELEATDAPESSDAEEPEADLDEKPTAEAAPEVEATDAPEASDSPEASDPAEPEAEADSEPTAETEVEASEPEPEVDAAPELDAAPTADAEPEAADEADGAEGSSSEAESNVDSGAEEQADVVREKSAEEVATEQAAMALITALMKLRGALAASKLPIDVVGADEARQQQKSMLDQLDDYILPRLVQLEAPVLAVVGGSTGAGKSTLVNSLIGQVVSEPGVLRPTTRSPVLIHNPADAEWFTNDRVLPGMARTSADTPGGTEDPGQIRLVAADTIPPGLAILDAPDIDSVVEANRDLATQLLAAADLWLFVTTAARYADAVPWEFLQSASDRSTAVAVVLDRAPADTIDDITGHLAQMLLERGLGDSPLFSIKETVVDSNGMLASDVVASIKDWLIDLAADAEARSAVVRRTLQGAVTAMTKKTPAFAKAVRAQADTVVDLRSTAETAYDRAVKDVAKATQDGTMLRGEVLARWQEFVGTGELLKGLQTNVGRLRDKVRTAVVGKPPPTRDLNDAVESGLESLLREHAEAAAERAEESWQSTAAGRQLLATGDRDMGRMSKEFPAEASRAVREWQGYVLDLVRKEGADKRSTARILSYGVNGVGLSLMVVVFASTAGIPTGAEVGVGAGTAVVGQKLLEAVFGDQAVRTLAAKARENLDDRVHALMDAEFARYLAVLDQHPVDPDAPRQLTEAARAVEDCT